MLYKAALFIRFLYRLMVCYAKLGLFFVAALVTLPFYTWDANRSCCRTGCHSCPYGYKRSRRDAFETFIGVL